jgi:hypothetical protein
MNEAVVYHWWGYPSDAPPIANLRSPIMASIATLRGVNKSIPIYVIDVSDNEQDWMNYPDILDFKIIRQQGFLTNDYSHCQGYKNLSRLFDIVRMDIPEETILYVDSDVFFIQNPFPLENNGNKFCFNKYNSGYYYFNKNAPDFIKFKNIFEAYVITALNDENFRCITKQFGSCNDYFVLDETMMHYMYIKHRELFDIMQPTEHFTIGTSECNDHDYKLCKIQDIKMIHGNGTIVNNPFAKHQYEKEHSRGLICLGISQLYQNLHRALKSDVDKMFTTNERTAFLENQVDFDEKFIKKIQTSKTSSGHYLFSETILN